MNDTFSTGYDSMPHKLLPQYSINYDSSFKLRLTHPAPPCFLFLLLYNCSFPPFFRVMFLRELPTSFTLVSWSTGWLWMLCTLLFWFIVLFFTSFDTALTPSPLGLWTFPCYAIIAVIIFEDWGTEHVCVKMKKDFKRWGVSELYAEFFSSWGRVWKCSYQVEWTKGWNGIQKKSFQIPQLTPTRNLCAKDVFSYPFPNSLTMVEIVISGLFWKSAIVINYLL